jgi:hypothetical protein
MIRFLKRLLRLSLLLVLVLAVGLVIAVRLRYGGGEDFPDRTDRPAFPASVLEKVVDLDTPPGNIAVSPEGRVFMSLHPEARPELKVVELVDGHVQPYPDMSFQTGDGNPRYFRSVLSLRIDRFNRLWTLDNAHHGIEPARLLAFDLANGKVVH